jgi:uncharacterized damage-inducible protein DinB
MSTVTPLTAQYDLVRRTRESLFKFLETLPVSHLHTRVNEFGHGTIARTHIHAADCYLYWIGTITGLRTEPAFLPEATVDTLDVSGLRDRFAEVDQLADRFFATYADAWGTPVSGRVRWQPDPLTVTPLWLFTHTLTHEFHHKGQIVSMARALGHVPPDTDLVL